MNKNKMSEEVKSALHILRLEESWISRGLVSPAEIMAYAAEYRSNPYEHNLEHYPSYLIGQYIENNKSISNSEISNLLYFIELRLDEGEIGSTLSWIVNSNRFDNAQLQFIHDSVLIKKYRLGGIIKKRQYLNFISEESFLSDDFIDECLASSDSVLQRALVDSGKVPDKYLIKLEVEGLNKKVRNIARQKLSKK